MGENYTRSRLDDVLRRWFRVHGTEYPPTSVCSHVRYRIWCRNRTSRKSMRWTPPKGGLHPPCLAEDGNRSKSSLFHVTKFSYAPTY